MKTYTIRGLQMRYLEAELSKQDETEESCMFCWKTSCGCNAPSVKEDAFLNTPNENEVYVINELQYA